jgi:4-hydroxy-tetrahydrodipicolinate synthase
MFAGTHTAIVTPFQNGQVDEAALKRLVDFQFDNGVTGIVPCGTTGESPTLDHDEHSRVVKLSVEFAQGRGGVMAGTGSNSTREAIELTQEAEAAGATASLQVAPYYNKPTPEGLYQHFKAIADNTKLPIMLYNIPGRTGTSLSPDTTARLLDLPNVVSYKAASGTTEEVSQLRAVCGERLAIYSGDDALTLPMLAVGAVGVVSVAGHLVAREISQLVAAFLAGDHATALALHERLLPLCKALFLTTNPIPVKAALELSGWPVGAPRLPLVSASSDVRERLTTALAALRPT